MPTVTNVSEHAWKAWEACLECQRACPECQRTWETCLECQCMDGVPKLVDEKHMWNFPRKSFHLVMPAALLADSSCFQEYQRDQCPCPISCSFYFFQANLRENLYRIIEGIFITFRPLPPMLLPLPRTLLPLHHVLLLLPHDLLFLPQNSAYSTLNTCTIQAPPVTKLRTPS